MLKVLLKGGLGNQMFQYAYAKSKKNYNIDVLFNVSELEYGEERGITKRELTIDKFNIDETIKIENKKMIFKNIFSRINYFLNNDFAVRYNKFFVKKKNGIANGYFQTEKYFKNIKGLLLKDFTLKTEYQSEKYKIKKKELEELKKKDIKIIIVNVRRGDYVNDLKQKEGLYLLEADYYDLAFNKILLDLDNNFKYKIVAFSDDKEWITSFLNKSIQKIEKINIDKDFEFLGLGAFADYEQISLMYFGDIFLIPNSTFAWWGAWLAQSLDKKIYAPKKWFIGKRWNKANIDIVPDDWIRI